MKHTNCVVFLKKNNRRSIELETKVLNLWHASWRDIDYWHYKIFFASKKNCQKLVKKYFISIHFLWNMKHKRQVSYLQMEHCDIMSIDTASRFAENRREKSLALLTQNFVKLFVCSNVSITNFLNISWTFQFDNVLICRLFSLKWSPLMKLQSCCLEMPTIEVSDTKLLLNKKWNSKFGDFQWISVNKRETI